MTDGRLDLLLVNPPSRSEVYQSLSKFAAIEPPVWAGLIARFMLKRGYSVEILDAEALGLHTGETAAAIAAKAPRLAAFCIYGHQPSASTQCMPGAIKTLEMLRTITGDDPFAGQGTPITTLALGTHPSALPRQTAKEGFNYVVQGEGPYEIDAFLKGQDPDFISGLWTPDAIIRAKTPLLENLDEDLPDQAWELLDMYAYRPLFWLNFTAKNLVGGYASIQSSLGCPFRCSFCCINAPFGGPSYRRWSPANVAAQLANLVERYGITNIKFPDEMFVLHPPHVWQICNHLIDMKLGDHLNMWAYARIDTVKDERLLAHMRKAGFRWLGIGIESASKHVRDGVEKGRFGNEQIIDSVKRVQSVGLHVGANYIFGLPDDTIESMNETLDLAIEINAEHANFYSAMAYPGSPLHKMAKEKGWRLPEDAGGPGWIGYSQHAYETMPLPTETLTYQQVLNFRDEAFREYHERPEFLQMLEQKFGLHARQIQQEINALGMPKRVHREAQSK